MSKIYHLDEMEDFFGTDEWRLSIDVSDIWNKHSNGESDLNTFNIEYYNRIVQYQKNINELGNDVWNGVLELLPKLKESNDKETSISVYESIYDWADKNDILIKTK